jgi:hypothetical protein
LKPKTNNVGAALVFAALSLSLSAITHASVISGHLWHVPEAISQNAIPANVPGTTPDVTFDVGSTLTFSGNSVSVGTWLGSGSAFNIVENTPGTLGSLMDTGAQGSLVELLGFMTVTAGQVITLTHDDGLSLIIGGLDLGFSPAPTSPTTSSQTYTGPTGTFAFRLVYGECCGGPAVLQGDLPAARLPEPATMPLLGAMLAGLFVTRRRKPAG